MATKNHLTLLKKDVHVWNDWRQKNPTIRPDLSEANLRGANLSGADLSGANLRANLSEADLRTADLSGADLSEANLRGANLLGANLRGADFREANLRGADLSGANLRSADLGGSNLLETVFANTDLTDAKGLDHCIHRGPCTVDHRTLKRSGPLPLAFLRGCGLPDSLIDYLPSLLNQAIQFYTCFISYSSKDHEFAERLHADLQDKGVRCWFAPEDLKIGDELRPTFDQAIRVRDKLLIVLSDTSIERPWVKREVEQALDEEARRGELVLFPIRLDDAVLEATVGWATDVKRRYIGDFSAWKDHDAYRRAFERLLRDLKVEGRAE